MNLDPVGRAYEQARKASEEAAALGGFRIKLEGLRASQETLGASWEGPEAS